MWSEWGTRTWRRVNSDNGHIVSVCSCDRLAPWMGVLCGVCVFHWHPCGANVTAGRSHLTNHDIMLSTGPLPSPRSVYDSPFIPTGTALPVSVGQTFFWQRDIVVHYCHWATSFLVVWFSICGSLCCIIVVIRCCFFFSKTVHQIVKLFTNHILNISSLLNAALA